MRKLFVLSFAMMASFCLYAFGDKDSLAIRLAKVRHFVDSVNSAMHYETGTVNLPGGIAALSIPEGFKYLNKEQSNYVISDLWGNPPDSAILGMILPDKGGPFADSSYAFVISYDDIGHVKDEDADDINYDEMLKKMQKDEVAANAERTKMGYSSVHIVGWAQKPYYDKENKILHWAKELDFGDEDGHTLNYDVRILGRKGILSLNAVASMDELSMVKKDIPKVLHIAKFTTGNTYKDFNPKVDEVAAWTIGGLVAGKILAKAGILAIIGKFLLAAWKFILLGLAAVWGAIRKFFGRKDEQIVYEPAATDGEEPPTT